MWQKSRVGALIGLTYHKLLKDVEIAPQVVHPWPAKTQNYIFLK